MTEGSVLFDPLVIRRLASDIGNEDLAFGFLSDYFELLPTRKDRIINAVRDNDPEAAMDAILSLKITSAMVGAKDAEGRCQVLQALVAGGNSINRSESQRAGNIRRHLGQGSPKDPFIHPSTVGLLITSHGTAPRLRELSVSYVGNEGKVPRPDKDACRWCWKA